MELTVGPLPLRLLKHPLVWMGVGMWVRNYGHQGESAQWWKKVGTVALVLGVGQSMSLHKAGKGQGRTMEDVVKQLFGAEKAKEIE